MLVPQSVACVLTRNAVKFVADSVTVYIPELFEGDDAMVQGSDPMEQS